MGHILGPESHVSIASLLRLLPANALEIWDRECGPFRPNSAVFAISGQVGNTISPWGKGPSQERRAILVAHDQGPIALGFRICSSSLAGDMQLTVLPMSPNFAFCAVSCPVARPTPRSTGGSQRDSKPNPNAQGQREYQGRCIEAWLGRVAPKASPGRSPKTADFAIFGVLAPLGDRVAPRRRGI